MYFAAIPLCLSAFLLFIVQPLIAQRILPWFGGGASVWMVCTVFFQVMLLLGYFYSDIVSRIFYRYPRYIQRFHSVIVCVVACFTWQKTILPVASVDASNPVLGILKILFSSVALPFFLLSTTSSLVQVFLSYDFKDKFVYRLYALSNVASLIALISYPFIFEPFLHLQQRQSIWLIGFELYCLGMLLLTLKPRQYVLLKAHNNISLVDVELKPTIYQMTFWVGMSLCSSLFLSSTTYHLSQDIAPIPLLWVWSLGIYMISYIVSFSMPQKYNWAKWEMRWTMVCIIVVLLINQQVPVAVAFSIFSIALYIVCYVCHAECVMSRPSEYYLGRFYLSLALGGALGAFLGAVIVPVTLGLSNFFVVSVALVFWVLGLRFTFSRIKVKGQTFSQGWSEYLFLMLLACVLGGACWYSHNQPFSSVSSKTSYHNFYGSSTVLQSKKHGRIITKKLMNGSTLHGFQMYHFNLENRPISYYANELIAESFKITHAKFKYSTIGVVGLGVGTLAAYAEKEDSFSFYELNPIIPFIAEKEFTYLQHARLKGAKLNIILGDARVMLGKNSSAPLFDILLLDAFSSDSIPNHLLTQEAMAIYQRRLKKDGVLLIHISHRYLDFSPVVARMAERVGQQALMYSSEGNTKNGNFPAIWVLLSSDKAIVASLKTKLPRATLLHPIQSVPLWTDDHYSFHCLWKDYPCYP